MNGVEVDMVIYSSRLLLKQDAQNEYNTIERTLPESNEVYLLFLVSEQPEHNLL